MGEEEQLQLDGALDGVQQSRTATAPVVLCVDDQETNRHPRSRALHAAGFAVIEAADGAGALDLAAAVNPALIVLDIRLPDLSGFEVCRRLKSDPATQAIPILHVSALGSLEEDLPAALEQHSDAYLREPVAPDTLVATARALIRAAEAERRQNEAEQRARSAERKSERLLDSVVDPIVAFDREWRYTYVSRRAAQLLGKSPEEMTGRSMWELFPEDADAGFQGACRWAWNEGRPVTAELYSKVLDCWVENYIYPSEDGACCQWRDVTGRKLAEQALRETEARERNHGEFLASLLANVPSGVAVMEGPELRYTLANARYQAIAGTGIPVVGRTFAEVFPEAAASGAEESFQRVLETGEPWLIHRYRAPIPSKPDATWEGEVIRLPVGAGGKQSILVLVSDVTERARTEERARRASDELDRARRKYQNVLESITDGLLVLDKDWRYTYFSEHGARMLGLRTQDLIGRCVWELFPHAHGTRFYEGYHRAVETGQPVQFEEYYPEPLNRWIECHCYPSEEGLSVYFQDVTERQRAVEILRDSERRYSALFANKVNAIAHCRTVTDEAGRPVDYEILQVNGAYETITGLRKGDVEGKLATAVFPGIANFSFDYIGNYGKVALEGGELSFETFFETLRQWYSVYVYSPKRGEFVAMFTDITARKETERALQESEARYRGLFESMQEGYVIGEVICDAEGKPADWRYLDVNPAMAARIGRTREEILGRTYGELFPDAPRQYWVNGFGTVALTGTPARLEGYGGGTGRYYSGLVHSPGPRQFAAILADITERREAEDAVLRHREWLRVTLGSIGDCVLATDAAGNISFLNGAAESLTGWTEADALGRPTAEVFRIINEKTRETVDDLVARVLREGRVVPLANHTALIARDGREIPIEDSAAPIRDSGGNLIGAVLVFHDVTEERRAADALRDSEAQFRTLANAIPQLCWIANVDGWITWYNQRWYEYTGTTPQQMEGWGWQAVHDPAALPAVMERWKASIATGQPFDMVFPLRSASGVFRPFLTRVMPVRDRDSKVVRWFGTNTDIGEQREIEEALRESEERFRALVMASSDVVYRVSPDWSEMRQLHGRNLVPDTLEPTRDWLERYIAPEDRPRVAGAFQDAVRNRGVVELEHRFIRADGSIGWAFARAVPVRNAAGEIIEWFGAATDITRRKEAEEALRISEARERARGAEMEAVLTAVPVAMFIAQDPECRNIVGNPMAYEMLRVPPGANISKSAPESERPAYRPMRDGREIPPEELPAQKAAATGRPVRNYEFDLLYENGDRRYMLGDAVPLFDEHGRSRGAVGAFVDITERKRQEERLRQAQKLESVGLLAGGIAHDFNNLLTGMMGNASLVMEEVSPAAAERIRDVVASAERAAHLTRQLLAYSGKGAFVLRNLDISEAVHEIAALVEFSIPKSVQLAVTVQRRLPAVRIDPSQFQQILMNLVINAGEAIGEGHPGRIEVRTSLADFESPLQDAAGNEVAPGRYVYVEVADNGPGMDDVTASKIFDPFFTTKFTGRGLGLAAVAGILRSMKGAITLKTAPGTGATFRVYLPVADKHEPDPDSAAEHLGTVLVVDDESTVRNFIGAVLRRRGYRVLSASDGREALSLSKDAVIDAMVLDVVMPIMGANELLPSVVERQPNVRILLTSGYSESEARRLCAQYPGTIFIQKPYTAQQIVTAVDALFGVRGAGSGG